MKESSIILTYMIIGFLTFGFTYNERIDVCDATQFSYQHERAYCEWQAGSAFFPSVFWPIYWGGRLSIEVFE